MKTSKMLAVLIVTFSVPSFAFVQGFTDLKDQFVKQNTSGKKVRTIVVTKCLDFSGSWTGTCKTNTEQNNATMEIKQSGCTSMTVKSGANSSEEQFDLTGIGLKSKNESGVFGSYSLSLGTHWDSKGETIQVGGAFAYNSPFVDHVLTVMVEGQIMFDGPELVSFFKSTGNMPGGSQNVCRYSKVK